MKRMIVKMETKKGAVYELSKAPGIGEYLVDSIEYRRDGLVSINNGQLNGSHYLITLVHPVEAKNVVYKAIPYDAMEEVMFVEIVKEEEESPETAKVMKRA